MKTNKVVLVASALLAVLGSHAGLLNAEESQQLSAAEQEANLAMDVQIENERLVRLCQHVLVYGTEDQKAGLLALLGDSTCSESPQVVLQGD